MIPLRWWRLKYKIMDAKTIAYDGNEEIIYSGTFNVYENELTIDFLEKKFILIFEKTEPAEKQVDLSLSWEGNTATVVLSKKFRNSLGSGTSSKIPVLNTQDDKQILFSVFGQQFGEDGLSVVVNFYLK